ncbi:YggS family pyridoxal phosphate-dependent enzyme [Brevundimonas subvibrioides]|uniref:Pyridoxal phosphate homeostasis protein n=1 Tax=Brevundimonas subvibrioides (strain ATCC 15264 / DSM 4735 / LMG 14903 / NBRC 16000 / CB 81) TaxID=633149 RepID=D9QJU3_BRESC|nr:YggS family pyridoxal phosphate-dependent enzyme [Brevundimonas subvibrioides]ADK99694.1 alanine racemase domain protein [Brevundimonas subvibrioides ATCC 15264]
MPASASASSDLDFAGRLAVVRSRILGAAKAAGRDPASVTLTAVSKTQPPEAIDAALSAGLRVFGENRVQEAQGRWLDRRAGLPDLELRLIGPLQSNKAEDAVALFDVIETLDREKLVGALASAAAKVGRSPRLLVQVNTGEEPQKAGVAPRDADALIALARAQGLTVEGLMAIPPADEEPILHFALLARIAERNGLGVLSMGMSGDYEAAIRLGSTHVRVGSALFGERNPIPAPSSL